MLDLPVWFEVGSLVVLGLIILLDLLLVVRRPHEPSMKEAGLWVAFYISLALVFAGAMFAFTGPEFGGQFVAGWVTEYSLSIDNLFVFIIIMARFSVPRDIYFVDALPRNATGKIVHRNLPRPDEFTDVDI